MRNGIIVAGVSSRNATIGLWYWGDVVELKMTCFHSAVDFVCIINDDRIKGGMRRKALSRLRKNTG